MAFALIVTLVICGSLSVGNAITCNECNGYSSTDADLNTMLASVMQGNTASCQSPTTTECDEPAGCMSSEVTFHYTSDSGDISVTNAARGCGAPMTQCVDADTMPEMVNGIKSGVEHTLQGSQRQFTYSSHEGQICTCGTNQCNEGVPAAEGETGDTDVTGDNPGETGDTVETGNAGAQNTTGVMETTTNGASSRIASVGLILVALVSLLACKMV